MSHHTEALVAVAALIMWSVYRRVRRTLRWQPLAKRRLAVRGSLFVVVGVLLLVTTLQRPAIVWWDAAGAVAGAVLAWLAVRNTRYERRADGWYYRPHGAIGALVILLFLARLAYRVTAAEALWNGQGTAGGGQCLRAERMRPLRRRTPPIRGRPVPCLFWWPITPCTFSRWPGADPGRRMSLRTADPQRGLADTHVADSSSVVRPLGGAWSNPQGGAVWSRPARISGRSRQSACPGS